MPTRSLSRPSFRLGISAPSPRPTAIASAIQSGRKRSSSESFFRTAASSARRLAERRSDAPRSGRAQLQPRRGSSASSTASSSRPPTSTCSSASRSRDGAVAGARPVDLTLNQPRVLQHLQMLRDGRLGERQLVDDLAAEAGLAARAGRAGSGRGPDARAPSPAARARRSGDGAHSMIAVIGRRSCGGRRRQFRPERRAAASPPAGHAGSPKAFRRRGTCAPRRGDRGKDRHRSDSQMATAGTVSFAFAHSKQFIAPPRFADR